ncbi:MAG: histidine kinase [Prevotella sp.]|nr:histidine kinase [Prevotella sp.]
MNIRRSFSTKLSLWVLIMAVPVFCGSVGLLFYHSQGMIRGEAVQRANVMLDVSLQRIHRYLITVETATNSYSWLIEKSMQPDSLMAISERIVRFNPYSDGCAISIEPDVIPQYPRHLMAYSIRKDSDSITTTLEKDYNYFTKEWYATPRDSHKPAWVVYYDEANRLNLDQDGMIATYSRPLYDAQHQYIGVVSTEMSLLHISEILAGEKPYPNSYFILLDEKGRYVGHPDSTRLFNKTIFSVANLQKQKDLIVLGHEMTKGNQGEMSVTINDVPSLVCYKPVPGTSWSLAIVCPDSDILKDYYRFIFIAVTLLIVALAFIAFYCYKMMARSLSPLRQLLCKTQEIAKGDLKVEIERIPRIDEMGCLQNSYVTMLESLRQYMDSVRAASDKAHKYNEELEKATLLVQEADRQKTSFIQNMTHQVRTPLNVIMGYAQILNSPSTPILPCDCVSEEEIKGLTATMEHNSKLLTRLILMLLDSSDSTFSETAISREREAVSANSAMMEMVDYVMQLYPDLHVIRFETEVPDDLLITTNRRFLQYSLAEVLLNAVKYSDGQHIMTRITRTDTAIRFIIEDTGKGIAEADRERIFKFFTKVDDFSEGLGLGLPLTRRHVKNLGGKFWLDTNYHDGCRFIFEFPL